MSSISTITHACARHLADVLSPLVGQTEHHVKNSKEFADYVKTLRVGPKEELRRRRVSTFHKCSGEESFGCNKKKIGEGWDFERKDTTIHGRHHHSIGEMFELHILCVQGQYFLQIHGSAMGSL